MDRVGKLERIGKYDVLDVLGQGGMGVVYRARDPVIARQVAIKVILDRAMDAPAVRERFYREARSAGALSHENVMTIYDVGEDDGRPYIVMELLDGTDLRHLLGRRPLPSLDTRLDIAIQVCQGLGYAHSRGVVHRDIKPENVQVTTSGRVKLLDFGIARIQTETHTLTQAQIGTPRYMSPEQIKGEPIDGRTDIFSFGVLLYELLSGSNPFAGEHITSVIYKVLHEDPPPPPLPDTPAGRDLQRIVARCMAKSPHRRYAKFAEVSDALRAVRNAGFDDVQEAAAAKPGLFGWLRRDTPVSTPPPIPSAHPGSTSSSTLPAAPPPLRGPTPDTGATVFASAPPPLDATVILPREERGAIQPPPIARADTPSTPPALEALPPGAEDDIDDDLLEGLVTGDARSQPMDETIAEPATEALESLTVDDPHAVVEDAGEMDSAPALVTDDAAAAAEAIDTDAGGAIPAPSAEALPEPGVPVPYLGAIAGVEIDETTEGPGEAETLAGADELPLAAAEDMAEEALSFGAVLDAAGVEEAPAEEETAAEIDREIDLPVEEAAASAEDALYVEAEAPAAPDETVSADLDVSATADETMAFAAPEIDVEPGAETLDEAIAFEAPEADTAASESRDETFAFTPPTIDTESGLAAGPDATIAFETPEVDAEIEAAAADETFAFSGPRPGAEGEALSAPEETLELAAEAEAEPDGPASPDETFAFQVEAPVAGTEAEGPASPDETFALAPPDFDAPAKGPTSLDEAFHEETAPPASPDETAAIEAHVLGEAGERAAFGPPALLVPGPALGANARAAALDALGLMPPAPRADATEPDRGAEREATVVPPLPRARGGKGRRGRRDAPPAEDRAAEEAPAVSAPDERRTDTGTLIPPLPSGPKRADTTPAPFASTATQTPLAALAMEEPRPRSRAIVYAGVGVLSVLAVGLVYMGLRDDGGDEASDSDRTARHVDPVPPEGLVALGAAARAEMERMTVQRDSAAGAGVEESANFVAAVALQTEAEAAFGRGGEADLRRATEAAREAAGLFMTARLSGTATAAELRERATQAERTAAAARQSALSTRAEPGAATPFDRGETALAAARRAVQSEDYAEASRLFGDAERAFRASRTAAAADDARVAAADVERQRIAAARARSRAMASASDGPLLASAEREYSAAARNARNRNYRAALTGYENAARLYGQATRTTRPADPDPDPPASVLTPGTPPADVMEAARRTDAARAAASGNTGSAAYRQGERARSAAGAAMRRGDYAEARSLYAGARAAFEEAGRGREATPERETTVSPVPSIGQYAADLQRAFENENLGALRAFHPYFNRYAGLFDNADDIHATVSTAPPEVSGNRATVAVTLSLRYQASGRTESPPPVRLRWTLEQRGSTWRLVDVASR